MPESEQRLKELEQTVSLLQASVDRLEEAVRTTGGRNQIAVYMLNRGFSIQEWEAFWRFFHEVTMGGSIPEARIAAEWQRQFPGRTAQDLVELSKILVQSFEGRKVISMLQAAWKAANEE